MTCAFHVEKSLDNSPKTTFFVEGLLHINIRAVHVRVSCRETPALQPTPAFKDICGCRTAGYGCCGYFVGHGGVKADFDSPQNQPCWWQLEDRWVVSLRKERSSERAGVLYFLFVLPCQFWRTAATRFV